MHDENEPLGPPEMPADRSPIAGVYNHGNRRIASEYGADEKYRLLTLEGLDRRTMAYRETQQLVTEIEFRRRRAPVGRGTTNDRTRSGSRRDRQRYGGEIPAGPQNRPGGALSGPERPAPRVRCDRIPTPPT